MQIVYITRKDPVLNIIPQNIPVNFEFDFCEQYVNIGKLSVCSLDVHRLSSEEFTKAVNKLKRLRAQEKKAKKELDRKKLEE